MDWLCRCRADTPGEERILRIPLPSGESSSVPMYQGWVKVSIDSAMKAQKCLREGGGLPRCDSNRF
ncbi:hypothetical protein HanIR_Chr14g0671641 [Helianthus annuus]|nr:hypothetical protein HanIR_Chr14g0671641 [Helianthus annuus]